MAGVLNRVSREQIFRAVEAERDRQEAKWAGPHAHGSGSCASPHVAPAVKAAVLAEECGEVARAVLDGNLINLRDELVQVAAVAIAWLEGM